MSRNIENAIIICYNNGSSDVFELAEEFMKKRRFPDSSVDRIMLCGSFWRAAERQFENIPAYSLAGLSAGFPNVPNSIHYFGDTARFIVANLHVYASVV